MSRPADRAGLAAERTALAWQRTALSLAAACAVVARLTWADLGLVAGAVLAVALGLSVWVFVESRLRYSPGTGASGRREGRSGRAPLALATSTALIAATELTAVLAT